MIFAALGGMFALGVWYFFFRPSDPQEGDLTWDDIMSTFSLRGVYLPQDELDVIQSTALQYGIDARLLAAIRKAENGGPGREFGIMSVPAPTYTDQARAAAQTIKNNQARYEAETGYSSSVLGRLTDQFIAYLGGKYAPVGASNDPSGLNNNWVRNVMNFYHTIDYAA